MNEIEYKDFYDRVGISNGWDFSKLRVTSEGVTWQLYEEVKKKCSGTEVLLDIGTGGGENVLNMASSFLLGIGIDNSNGMMSTAQSNLNKANVSNVRFVQMSSECLQFPSEFFDVISCCHAPFSAGEAARVLKKGGFFLTQQVGEADKLNLKSAFGRGQSFGVEDGVLRDNYITQLQEAGFHIVELLEYDALEYYERPEDLIFLLKHTPIIPNFGQHQDDFSILNDFIANNRTPKGICTNSRRFMIVASK
ncbi:class I SAM-dependent methyltransferase [Paenibacillus glycanilyticus]|uniref:Methyltransferase n=1 Tax=Paenibacillus glycanilyticus TaxID=126569 RepID=A0ABQ6GE26_9BACL|nr:class I SAM-dependent methyltransferase [Paenibacillus glycanilyticus]GLX67907.1 methyltransferase [Paenibacillus glycanilyticus]